MEKDCSCELQRGYCPDQRDLVGGSLFPNMPCFAILKALESMNTRIDENLDCSIKGLSPFDKEADKLHKQVDGISARTMVELVLNE